MSALIRAGGRRFYLKVEPLTLTTKGLGDKVRLLTRGKLPYKLRWQSEIIEANRPLSFAIGATGDFDGRGVWSLQQQGRCSDQL